MQSSNIGEKLEDVRVERRPHQFSYNEGEHYHFLNQETWDDLIINKDLITGVDFLKEGMVVEVVSDASTETVLFAELPVKVQLEVTYTEPGLKGDTATNTTKPATLFPAVSSSFHPPKWDGDQSSDNNTRVHHTAGALPPP